LSLAEVDEGIQDVLGLTELENLECVTIRAFMAAKAKAKKLGHASAPQGDDQIMQE